MRYWLLAVCLLLVSISVVADSDTVTLDPITTDNVAQIEILRQFGTVPEHFCDCADQSFRVENNDLYYQRLPDQFVHVPTPTGDWGHPLMNIRSGPYLAAILTTPAPGAKYNTHYVVMVWDIDSDSPTLVLTTPPDEYPSISWRPDSGAIAVDSTVYRIPEGDVAFQHTRRLYSETDIAWCEGRTETSEGSSAISWSPDSTRYAALAANVCASSIASYGIFDAETGALLYELEGSTVDTNWSLLNWSPGGTKVTNGIDVWSAETGGAYLGRLRFDRYYSLDLPSVMWLDEDTLLGSHENASLNKVIKIYTWEASSGLALFEDEFPQVRAMGVEGHTLSITSGFAHMTIDMDTRITETETVSQPLGGSLAWSPDASHLLVVTGSTPSPLMQVWDAASLLNDSEPRPALRLNADWMTYQQQSTAYIPQQITPVWLNNDEFFTYSSNSRNELSPLWARIRRWNQATQQASDVYWSPSSTSTFVPNPDLTQLAEITDETAIRILDSATREEVTRLTGVTLPAHPSIRWSPTGDQLAMFNSEGTHEVYVWDLDQPDVPHLIPAPERSSEILMERDDIDEVSWHPNGKYLALVRFWSVDIIDVTGNRLIHTYTIDEDANIHTADWNFDGSLLMMRTYSSHGLIILDGLGKNILAEFPTLQWGSARWSPDGRLVAYSDGDNLLLLGIPEQD